MKPSKKQTKKKNNRLKVTQDSYSFLEKCARKKTGRQKIVKQKLRKQLKNLQTYRRWMAADNEPTQLFPYMKGRGRTEKNRTI